MKLPAYVFDDASEQLNMIADELSNNLVWSETAEGHNFWRDVHARLKSHAAMAASRPGGVSASQRKKTKATQTPVQETLVQTKHVIDKDGYILCGMKVGTIIPRGHLFVHMKDKEKTTCALCKSKLPL